MPLGKSPTEKRNAPVYNPFILPEGGPCCPPIHLVLMIIKKLVSTTRMQLCALVGGKANKSGHKVTNAQVLWMTVECVFKEQPLHFIVVADAGRLEGEVNNAQ